MGKKDCESSKINKRNKHEENVNSVDICTFVKNLNFLYTNADQLSNKMTDLVLKIQENKPHVVGMTEVKP